MTTGRRLPPNGKRLPPPPAVKLPPATKAARRQAARIRAMVASGISPEELAEKTGRPLQWAERFIEAYRARRSRPRPDNQPAPNPGRPRPRSELAGRSPGPRDPEGPTD